MTSRQMRIVSGMDIRRRHCSFSNDTHFASLLITIFIYNDYSNKNRFTLDSLRIAPTLYYTFYQFGMHQDIRQMIF